MSAWFAERLARVPTLLVDRRRATDRVARELGHAHGAVLGDAHAPNHGVHALVCFHGIVKATHDDYGTPFAQQETVPLLVKRVAPVSTRGTRVLLLWVNRRLSGRVSKQRGHQVSSVSW